MLTQLVTVKKRLEIPLSDVTHDEILTRAIEAVSARFDRECNRTFARTVGATEEFTATDMEVMPRCFPVEVVTKFELEANQTEGWVLQSGVKYLLREGCVISLNAPLAYVPRFPTIEPGLGRITYTGGYVLPGDVVGLGQTALPVDLESAALEEIAGWYQQRDKVGLLREWPSGGTYLSLSQLPLLPEVTAVLRRYQRWVV
jgi:hypothetical protein